MLDVSKVLAAAGKVNKGESVQNLRLCDISRDESQPRTVFDDQSLLELATDIEQHGLLQPILVREDGHGKYVIIAGERRYKAFSLLNKPEIPCIVKTVDSDELSTVGYMQMSENLKRDNLRFYEIAEFIQARVDGGEIKGDVAKKLGISNADLSRYLSWTSAPEWLKAYKNRFASVRTFNDYVQFAKKEDEEALEKFMANSDADNFTSSMLKQLKAKPTEDMDAVGSDSGESVVVSDGTINDDDMTESFESDSDKKDYSESTNDDSESEYFDEEPSVTNSIDDDDSIQEKDSFDESHESDSFSEVESDDMDSSDISSNSLNEDSFEESSNDEDVYTRPVILGYVDGREAELLYKTKTKTEGFIMVKYEDGSQAETLAENFKLNRIIEG
jgi:ParB/RepB/Spo0J family partition protein